MSIWSVCKVYTTCELTIAQDVVHWKLQIKNVKCKCVSECFYKYSSMSCQCVDQGMKIKWGSLFAKFVSLSLEDATMLSKCASKLCHFDYCLPLVKKVMDTCVFNLNISHQFHLTLLKVSSYAMSCHGVASDECYFSCFAFVLDLCDSHSSFCIRYLEIL